MSIKNLSVMSDILGPVVCISCDLRAVAPILKCPELAGFSFVADVSTWDPVAEHTDM